MIATALDKLIAGGLLAAIGFTALAHGAVESWSVAFFELLILLLMLLWAIKIIIVKQFELKIPITAWPILAFLILGLIQCIAIKGGDGSVSSLSFDVESTRSTVKVLFFLFAAHLLAANFFTTRERLFTLAKFLTIFGFILSVFSLIQYFTRESIFFWERPQLALSIWLTGPFVNHNHFAGYMELILPFPVAVIATGAARQWRMLCGFAAVTMATALVATVSRAGIISLGIELVFIFIAGFIFSRSKNYLTSESSLNDVTQRKREVLRNSALFLLIIGAIFIGIVWVGADPLVNRLVDNNLVSSNKNAETFEGSRGWIWKNSFTVFRSNPVFGVGLGAFETALPIYSESYKASPDGKLYIWERAHNDYLQILCDTGVIGGAIALWFILTVLYAVKRGFGLKDRFLAGVAVGCSAAILALLFHSVFDFNLQLPSTSLLFLVLTAVLVNLTTIQDELKPKSANGLARVV